jgi:hypothetical protein
VAAGAEGSEGAGRPRVSEAVARTSAWKAKEEIKKARGESGLESTDEDDLGSRGGKKKCVEENNEDDNLVSFV